VFSRKKRFPRALFPSAIKTGRRFSSTNISILIPKEGKGYAVVVPKKIVRLSVKRHAIKRRILAALRAIHLPPAIIVFPKSSASSVSYQDIKTELTNLIP
jgi:ribonuclease P protein component